MSNGVSIDDISGIAPGAWLGNYNVFPGDVLNARSQDILGAVEAAVADGMDVLNMSLGGTATRTEENDLLAVGRQQRRECWRGRGGSIGQQWTRGSALLSLRASRAKPSRSARAQTNISSDSLLTYPATGGTTIGAAVGDFDPLPAMSFDLFDTAVGRLYQRRSRRASGKLAIIDRGTCVV